MKKIVFGVLVLLLAPSPGGAFIVGGSNFGSFIYPAHSCGMKPILPSKPFAFSSQQDIDDYNEKIKAYNKTIKEYSSCINEYLDNANRDMQRIREKAKDAVDEMNRSY